MKKRLVTALACLFVLSMSLAACGAGSSTSNSAAPNSTSAQTSSESAQSFDADAAKAAFVGTWDIVELKQKDGSTIDKLGIEAAKKSGGDYYVRFDEDGTVTFVSGEQSATGAWAATSESEGELAIGSSDRISMKLENGQIIMLVDGSEMKLEPGAERAALPAAANSSAASTSASSSSQAASKKQQKYDVSIDDATVGEDYKGNPALIVTYSWTNNSDSARSFASALYPKCYQDGVQLGTAMVMSGIDSNGYTASVKPGHGTTLQMAYELKDTSTPVEVEVGELASFNNEVITSKTIEL